MTPGAPRLDLPARFDPTRHDVADFDCGSEAQSGWLRRVALTAQAARTAVVYAVTLEGEDRVVGFHALAAASVAQAQAGDRLRRAAGRGPIPVVLLARIGVDRRFQGQGLGAALVKDAVLRALAAAETIGARALLVHAESSRARDFYMHLAEFEPSPTDPLHFVLLMTDIEATLGRTTGLPGIG